MPEFTDQDKIKLEKVYAKVFNEGFEANPLSPEVESVELSEVENKSETETTETTVEVTETVEVAETSTASETTNSPVTEISPVNLETEEKLDKIADALTKYLQLDIANVDGIDAQVCAIYDALTAKGIE